jgi:carbonyl reductase 1
MLGVESPRSFEFATVTSARLITTGRMVARRPLAVVSGGNKGVGFYIAAQLLASGHDVLIGCRSLERGAAAAAALGAGCRFAQLDISDGRSVVAFAEGVREDAVPVDVLVNNAAIAFKASDPTPFAAQTRPTLATNFEGTLALTEAMLPALSAQARIVNVASMSGKLSQLAPDLQYAFAADDLTVAGLRALVGRFERDVADGVHRKRGWSNSNYGLSKLAVIAYTRVLARTQPSMRVNVRARPGRAVGRGGGTGVARQARACARRCAPCRAHHAARLPDAPLSPTPRSVGLLPRLVRDGHVLAFGPARARGRRAHARRARDT